MKILIVKSLFCPNKQYLQKNFDSLIKLDAYLKLINTNNTIIDLYLIGWANQFEKEITIFLKLIKFKFINICTDFWKINYGKYYLFEKLRTNTCIGNYDYLLYMDHDIYFSFDNVISFPLIFSLLTEKIENDDIGVIVPNQLEDCRHQGNIYENNHILNNMDVCYSNTPGSIAMGCFIIKSDLFLSLDEFKLISVYGLDDIYILDKIKEKNCIAVITSNFYVVHPYSNNDIYNQWKYNNIIKMINGEEINYHRMIEESIELWNNIN